MSVCAEKAEGPVLDQSLSSNVLLFQVRERGGALFVDREARLIGKEGFRITTKHESWPALGYRSLLLFSRTMEVGRYEKGSITIHNHTYNHT